MGKIFDLKEINIKDIYLLISLGLFLCLNLYIENIVLQISSLFVLSFYFYIIEKYKNVVNQIFLTYIFFSGFLFPSTYYYFNTFPIHLALIVFIASPFLFTSISIPILIPKIRKSKFKILSMGISYIFLSYIFLTLEPFKNWWIPHIGYTQSINYLSQISMPYFGMFGLFFFIIAFSYLNFVLFKKYKKDLKKIGLYVFFVFMIFISFNFTYEKTNDETELNLNFIQVQHWFYEENETYEKQKDNFNKIENINLLFEKIDIEYENIKNKSKNTIVVFGEIDLNETSFNYILNVSKEKNYFIGFSYIDFKNKTIDNPYNKFVLIENGKVLYSGYKENKAPGERISEKINSEETYLKVENSRIYSAICYDLHYVSSNHFLRNKDLILAHVNDFKFGRLLTTFHKKDIVFRAIENSVNILSVGTTGPTFFVNKKGVIENDSLPLYENKINSIEK